jgi:phosphoglycerol transferase MdoB-like AlkP superfamily enzyme
MKQIKVFGSDDTTIGKAFLNVAFDIVLVYFCYFLCRVVFLAANYNYYEGKILTDNFFNLVRGSLVFDTSAIVYTNLLFLLLALFPLHFKEMSRIYGIIVKSVFVAFNTIGMVANLCDVVYFRYTGRRTTGTVFAEFSHDDNLTSVFATEALHSWYLIIIGIAILLMMIVLYQNPLVEKKISGTLGYVKYYALRTVFLAIVMLLGVAGGRGGIDRSTRPITISNANQYISNPVEAPLILNTPFSLLRTWNKKPFVAPEYFTQQELDSIYTPVHQPVDSIIQNAPGKGRNVVVIIVESFAREYIGNYNPTLENGQYQGYTPFIDSLMQHSLWFYDSFTNGRKSIDGMPSILSSIPYFVEPFFLTPAALNTLDGLAVELKNKGYYSAFFHGAKNGSMGFEAFARATGFDDYFGRTEFDQQPEFGGDAEFDGFWAIWDEPFLQFYCHQMSQFAEPFMTAVFTASSHHPFQIPAKYVGQFEEGPLPIHKCIRYTDYSLRRFFDEARKQPWFNNTVFVICNDHTNQTNHAEYQTDLGTFTGPVIFYAPGDTTLTGAREGIAQQIDVMPTLLGYLGYDQPYVAFGQDLLHTPESEKFAVSYCNGIYQIVMNGYLLQFDGTQTKSVYALSDKLLENNLIGQVEGQLQMETKLKAIIQQYMSRMNEDRMVVGK